MKSTAKDWDDVRSAFATTIMVDTSLNSLAQNLDGPEWPIKGKDETPAKYIDLAFEEVVELLQLKGQKPERIDQLVSLLKETLAEVLDLCDVSKARERLAEWCRWAARSRLAPFKKLAGTIRAHTEGILAYVESGLSNGRTEGLNGKIRTITRRAFGFHSASGLIALIFLCCSGLSLSPVFKRPQVS